MQTEKTRNTGLFIVLLCCLVGTIIALIFFSAPNFHENIDILFQDAISWVDGMWNSGTAAPFILLGCGIAFPILGALAVTPLDSLLRCLPMGEFLTSRVKLGFDDAPGVRFLPAFLFIIYFIVGAFINGANSDADFNVENYNPFLQQYTAAEWVNWVFVVLAVFSLLLIIAEGVVNAGPIGVLIHLPIVIVANIYIVVLAVIILFVAVTLLGFIGKILAVALVLPFLGACVRPKTEIRYIPK